MIIIILDLRVAGIIIFGIRGIIMFIDIRITYIIIMNCVNRLIYYFYFIITKGISIVHHISYFICK
ncbi:hypothetical protein GLOIN_2v1724104 [Rhizophagus irregularis DAOM 181602=DAOM 197198]|uniref:Uncharacterized protein n=1 Tax=Rhizophagus irregularis (strain DAOM 181602 / DAOM 197198 / MUCL 43194) TaxID=747089 RepID=A0A2P4P1D5_RHIID|nr:hypothetical protein GLOIN_2v1724104 [Rhizophagus irregularis DAOM 181602=DAOM 197198]POG59191.1 hypothetical protein GLOIN_2v1724104 [Rhizophagus irregularis DAOM 181602=DAOM 197198]|eukprot:XP_025166057.1 hypothetical protein GLOIN_2v1724104 [Rhizophagus irregularis DAOM 181602=DAOM 197198]